MSSLCKQETFKFIYSLNSFYKVNVNKIQDMGKYIDKAEMVMNCVLGELKN